MSKLLLYLDVETTDKRTDTAGITQLSALIVRDGVEVSRINLDVNPYTYNKEVTVSAKALEVTGKSVNELHGYPPVAVALIQFTTWLNKYRNTNEYYTLVAYRTAFDLEMLLQLFKDQRGDERKLYDYIHYKTLDILQLVLFLDLYSLIKPRNHKLETMCSLYNISIQAHDSMSDIESTRKLHKALTAELNLQYAVKNII